MRGQVPTEWGWMDERGDNDSRKRTHELSSHNAIGGFLFAMFAMFVMLGFGWGIWALYEIFSRMIGGK